MIAIYVLVTVTVGLFWLFSNRSDGKEGGPSNPPPTLKDSSPSKSPKGNKPNPDSKKGGVSGVVENAAATTTKKRKNKKGKSKQQAKAHVAPIAGEKVSPANSEAEIVPSAASARASPAPSPAPAAPWKPDMDTDDEDDGVMQRVLRVKPDELASAMVVEDGWQIVDAPKKPTKPRTMTIVGSSSSVSSYEPAPLNASDPTLTKKQKENLRKAERVKAAKLAQIDEQKARLLAYRKEQEKSWVAKEIERDKQKLRERTLAKGQQQQQQQQQHSRDPSGSEGLGNGIWS
ncbi:uncharacterized protein EV422DRAFT_512226 [Fimicolochytrium jonesii]|uniref:uncharacterized protein n=1 Tax=Fimicolochytrium jonesii TaxID=1396493 RepID=UPI0022FE26E9|nr:uncharacterized protein EV422DRAFT_512226 [Fimicolochytrium jonesii]KAI8826996.1 hypothetical protein EV422DRAFT_512226 [Fimicolochytrium jonesii]